MRDTRQVTLRFLAMFLVLGGLGLAAILYLLVKQHAPLPFDRPFVLNAEFTEANGVVGGIGQPVNVAGVRVGDVAAVRVVNGRAIVRMNLDRAKLPAVHRGATARLLPITPLNDMKIELDPGDDRAPDLRSGATLGLDSTDPPVPLSDLLSALDGDTRSFLASLISSVGEGTRGRSRDIRRTLLALGPTTADLRKVTQSLAARREEIARLVHNLGKVSRAASRDDRLAEVVQAGNQTLSAIAEEEAPLRRSISKLPATLGETQRTLEDLGPFARELAPASRELLPVARSLPSTFASIHRLSRVGTPLLRSEVRPLISTARPVVRDVAAIVAPVAASTRPLTTSMRVLTYVVNELAYNPPGDDEGFLFWLAWFMHNANSTLSLSDAHGGMVRGGLWLTCEGAQSIKALQPIFGATGACPK
jgi:phospholipid/cholesterol/gamma-HCH transport system substrate-binding protein